MLKSIRIRLYPDNEQKIYMNKLLGSSRFVYNNCLSYKIDQYNNHKKSVSYPEMGKYLTNLKKIEKYSWLKDNHSKVLQQSLINLDIAYKNFFINGNGFPKFKSKHNKQSCRFPIDAIGKIKGNRINIILKLKNIHFKCSVQDERYLNKNQDLIKSGTLNKTKSGKYYFSILIDKPNKKINNPKNEIIGIDVGIKDFVIDSNGYRYENIKIKRNNQKKLNKLHKELSKKQKNSNNREKSKIKLSKFYEKLNNKKEYYLHSVINQLLRENQTIVIENLNVKEMMKNKNLSKSIQELSLNEFKEILKYKSKWYDRNLIEIDRWFPSSKLCNICGFKNKELSLKDRKWICPECKTNHDRDINAAINIKNEGKRIFNIKENKIGLNSPKFTPLENNLYSELGTKCKISKI